jgi:hypothetical protein
MVTVNIPLSCKCIYIHISKFCISFIRYFISKTVITVFHAYFSHIDRYSGESVITPTRVETIKGFTVNLKEITLLHIPIYIQQDATLHSLFISGNCSTCFGWYFHPSSGAHTTVSTASGICHNTVTATCRYGGR